MVGESIAIVVVLLVTVFMGVRAGKKSLAQLTLPFLCVPACVLIGHALTYSLGSGPLRPEQIRLISVMVGAVLGSAFCVLAANLIIPKRARFAFVAGCLLFVVLMALAYIMPILAS